MALPFRSLQFKQGSQEWLDWRRQGIGASDAPIIMGESPYKKPWQLWEEKVGLREDPGIPDHVRERAARIEAAARAHYELTHDSECPPICMEMIDHPFLKASLDGYHAGKNFILEIKYVGAKAMEENIPMHHWIQLQHQMMVSGATDVTYIRSNDGTNFKAGVFSRDEKFISELMVKLIEFQRMVNEKICPEKPRRKTRS